MKTRWNPKETVGKPENNSGNDGLTELVDTGGNTADVIIVGAGVAGAALAYTLAKDGRRVHVLERDLAEPDRIVGEVLHPGGYMKLMELGLEDCVEGIEAQRVSGYAFYLNGKTIRLDYPLGKFDSNVSGKSFHNGRFIQRMRSKASFLPNVKLEQGTVTSLLKTQGTVHGVHYRTKGGHAMTAYAPLTIVCDGCFSNLRRELCNPKIEVPSCFVALVLENVDLPYANHGHAIIADPSPVLFYSISNTKIRCLVDVPGEKVPSISNGEMTKYLKTVVAPQIPHELYNAFIAAVDKGNIRTMPNKTMPAESKTTQGALLLGDALNMRHPLTGGGMTAALTDIVLLRDLLRPLHDLNDAYKHLQRFYTLRKPMSFTLNTVAGVGYKMFCASSDLVSRELRSACFSYLTLGHWFTDGLMAIFSGLDQRPVALFLQGTMMGAYIVGRLLMPFPSPKRLWLAAKLIPVAIGVIFPVIKSEGIMQVIFFPTKVPT
ncbi:squalene monooxygenase-like [Cynara cardunculus var. scolymus]|uniref:squalene monooxygenase-like n=1 Tax=Cynara cardunculus var. scolymus TaxID=59895 RepID=UPI000D630D0F|nr:squalene monooxygenase-like [Cynara cardunculus var. scolymus]